MTTPPLAPGDVLTVDDVMATLQIGRSAAYALAAKLGRNVPGVGVRVLRWKLEAFLADSDEEPTAPAAADAHVTAPRRRRGTSRACRGDVVAHGRTGAELRALTGTGRRKN